MQQEAVREISIDEAQKKYGISSPHQRMPNGELRFRLTSADGSAYVRTVATPESGWQRSHFHKNVFETYIVQRGWMALASLRDVELVIEKFTEGQLVTTKLLEPHNVYLPADAVIHTVKHGRANEKDWWPSPELDVITRSLSESDIQSRTQARPQCEKIDPRFGSYIDVYNNLDSLIWQIPGFFVAASAIFFGFVASSVQTGSTILPPIVWAVLFLFVGVLFLIGAYSMHRIRLHHTRMGRELFHMEPAGYFHVRSKIVSRVWPPSAPHVFIVFFTVLGMSCFAIAYMLLVKNLWLMQLIMP